MKSVAQILIVDDEPAAILLLRKTLNGMGELRYAISGQAEALVLAERVRAAVLALAIPPARSSASDRVSLSLGVASLQPAFAPVSAGAEPGGDAQPGVVTRSSFLLCSELFEWANGALFAAKQTGRNRVCLAGGAGPWPSIKMPYRWNGMQIKLVKKASFHP